MNTFINMKEKSGENQTHTVGHHYREDLVLCHWGALFSAGYGGREMSVLAIPVSVGDLVFP